MECIEKDYDVMNGMIELNRNIIMKLVKLMKDDEKTRCIFGMMMNFFSWSKLSVFRWVQESCFFCLFV
jgi:hypothetical protein